MFTEAEKLGNNSVEINMLPKAIKELRERLDLTQEVFARILGVSFATVNRWENGRTVPTGDYARVLLTLCQLSAPDTLGATIDWKRVGALSAMAAVAGFSPLLTLGAALAPVLIAHLPSWADVPLGEASNKIPRSRSQRKGTTRSKRVPAKLAAREVRPPAKSWHPRALAPSHVDTQRTGG